MYIHEYKRYAIILHHYVKTAFNKGIRITDVMKLLNYLLFVHRSYDLKRTKI